MGDESWWAAGTWAERGVSASPPAPVPLMEANATRHTAIPTHSQCPRQSPTNFMNAVLCITLCSRNTRGFPFAGPSSALCNFIPRCSPGRQPRWCAARAEDRITLQALQAHTCRCVYCGYTLDFAVRSESARPPSWLARPASECRYRGQAPSHPLPRRRPGPSDARNAVEGMEKLAGQAGNGAPSRHRRCWSTAEQLMHGFAGAVWLSPPRPLCVVPPELAPMPLLQADLNTAGSLSVILMARCCCCVESQRAQPLAVFQLNHAREPTR